MTYDPSVNKMWAGFLDKNFKDGDRPEAYSFVFRFGDSEALTAELLSLVLEGKKQATAHSPWFFEHDGQSIPQAGDYSISIDWEGKARCIIQTVQTRIVPFDEVDEEFARMEGEGDLSLAYWRKAHETYFSRECERIGKPFSYQMPVFCEVFKVVYSE